MQPVTELIACPACGQQIRAGSKCPFCWPEDISRAKPPPLPPHAYAPAPKPRAPRRSIIEILLDPRSIQWLLASGGVLLATGMVIWLASLGIFKDASVIASTLGAGTLLLLLAGWWVIRKTSFHLAGQAVTLLACLVMPLNLWFYHAHGIMTLQGNLWIAAVVCCVLYAASAMILRDPLFVYVLCAGVAGTGLLILGDMHKLAEIAAPSTMLAIMGLICIHAERAFADNDTSDFSRKRFGLAFFFSGHVLLGAGLLLLLGAQIVGWLLKPFISGLWNIPASQIVSDANLKLLAVALVLAGTYAYVWSDLVVRKIGAYVYPAAFTLLWAELLGLQMLDLTYGSEVIIATLSFTALLINVVQGLTSGHESARRFTRTLIPLAMLLSVLPVIYGVLLHFRATHSVMHQIWAYQISWGYVAAMAIAAIACRIGAFLSRKTDTRLTGTYLFLTGAASLVGAAGLLNVLGIQTWSSQAPILMLIPIAYLIASRLYKDGIERDALLSIAHVATWAMIAAVFVSATHLAPRVFEPIQGQRINFLLAIFFGESAIFFASLAIIRKRAPQVLFATAMAGAAVWEVLNYYRVESSVYMLVFAGLGLALLIVSRLTRRDSTKPAMGPSLAAMMSGDALMSLAFLSSMMMVFSRLVTSSADWGNATLLGAMMLMSLVASFVVGEANWRRLYVVMTIVNGALAFVVLGVMTHLNGWQKAEIFFELAGIALLIVGHIGWFREQGSPNDTVSFCLLLGALLAGLPVLIASVVNRFGYSISTIDEIVLVTISTLMLLSGLLLQLRATTIVGGSLLALHIAMLLASITWKAQLAVGVYLSIGGGAIFLLGLGLAIYRERLIELPQRIERREGVFKILAWR